MRRISASAASASARFNPRLYAPPAARMPAAFKRLHDHDIVLLSQGGGGLVQHVAAHRRGMSVGATDPGLGDPPPLRRLLPGPGLPGHGYRAGGRPAAAGPATGIARRSRTSVPEHGRPRSPRGSRPPAGCRLSPRHPHRPPDAPTVVRGRAGLGFDEGLERAVPAPGAVLATVADKIRAVPASMRRASLLVDSWVRTAPSRGSVTWRRSASIRIIPVVNRTAGFGRDLNRGNPRSDRRAGPCATPPSLQPAGQAVQAGVVGLLRVLPPPRRAVDLTGSKSCAAPATTTPTPGSAHPRRCRSSVRRPAGPSPPSPTPTCGCARTAPHQHETPTPATAPVWDPTHIGTPAPSNRPEPRT